MTARVQGWDLSLAASGICLPSGQTLTIRTKDTDPRGERLRVIREHLNYYLGVQPPTLVAIEAIPPSHRSMVAVIALAMVHSQALELLAEHGLPHAYVHQSAVKRYATGSTTADKPAMVAAANDARTAWYARTGETRELLTDDNEADGWWLHAMGRHRYDTRITAGLGQSDIDGHDDRHRIIFGPWKSKRGKIVTPVEWPDLGARTAVTRHTQPGPPPPAKRQPRR